MWWWPTFQICFLSSQRARNTCSQSSVSVDDTDGNRDGDCGDGYHHHCSNDYHLVDDGDDNDNPCHYAPVVITIADEESSFNRTLDQGVKHFNKVCSLLLSSGIAYTILDP